MDRCLIDDVKSMLEIRKVESRSKDTVSTCIDLLHEGAIVVVESQRLKHLIADGYNRSQLDNGKLSWPTPEVHVWSAWLSTVWTDLADHSDKSLKRLITSAQSTQIWENAIFNDIEEEYRSHYEYLLWHVTATATRAKSAYGLMCSYGIEASDFGDHISEDAKHFLRWLKNYQQNLGDLDCVDTEALPDVLREFAPEICDLYQANIVFAGFDHWTLQHQNLLDSLADHSGSKILECEFGTRPQKVEQIKFERVDDEINVCGRWARSIIEADPVNHKIGIVVPRLSEVYDRILRSFSGTMNPDQIMEKRELQNLSFHVTLGTSLTQTPLVVDALNLIELTRYEVEVSTLFSVIQSDRILDWDKEFSQRALLKDEILGIGHNRVTLEDVRKVIKKEKLRCPKLYGILSDAKEMLDKKPRLDNFAHWGSFIMNWMKLFQSEERENRQFGTNEMQAHQAWSEAVESLAELGFVSRPVPIETAIAKLKRIVSEISVQPAAVRVPIQIGEMVSLAGQSFTHMWMLGMNNDAVPGSPRPNPFIPISLQKEKGVPESAANLLEKFVSKRIDRLLDSAVEVVQSFAVTDGGSYYQPSSNLNNLQDFDDERMTGIAVYPDYWNKISEDRDLCRKFEDWKAKKVGDSEKIGGGSSILKNQSNCPFRGFAQHRLHIGSRAGSTIGIDAMNRGSMAHAMFEGIYGDASRSEMLSGDKGKLTYRNLARKYATQAVEDFVTEQVKPISDDLAQTEIERMVDLAEQWYEKEISRGPFEVVDRERKAEVSFSNLNVRMRIDRVDGTPNGLVVIDYKTGDCSIGHTKGDRPKEPQLLIYECALAEEGEQSVDIAYAKVKRGDVKYLARSKARNYEPVSIEEKKEILEQIANGFLTGQADVDPLGGACEYCDVYPVCRKDDRSEHIVQSEADSA